MPYIQASMTLVAVQLMVDSGDRINYNMYHGLVYDELIDSPDKLKRYAEDLAQSRFDELHKRDDLPEGVSQHYTILDYGIVVPDDVSIPDGKANNTFLLHQMEMPLSVNSDVDVQKLVKDHPNIKEIKS